MDEGLFQEDFDDIPSDFNRPDTTEVAGLTPVGVANEETINIDESLFDVENLQDLNLDDPSILKDS